MVPEFGLQFTMRSADHVWVAAKRDLMLTRISNTEPTRIRHMLDGEHRKVIDIVAGYECTPTNILMVLSKLRRKPANIAC